MLELHSYRCLGRRVDGAEVLAVFWYQEGVHQLCAASAIWADLFECKVLDVASNIFANLLCKVYEVMLAEDRVFGGHLQSDGAQVLDGAYLAEVLHSLKPLADVCFGDLVYCELTGSFCGCHRYALLRGR